MITALRSREKQSAGGDNAAYRALMSEWLRVLKSASEGDFEARAMAVPGTEDLADAAEFREFLNLLLDRMDAYVRESAASLEAANAHHFWRRYLPAGMAGSFRVGAGTINAAIAEMADTQACLDKANVRRLELADELEHTVLHVAEQLAAASTELSATSASLAESTRLAVGEVQSADETAHGLTSAAAEIEDVVRLITGIASQTQLLALNATIEAARAGEAGRSFAIVASEVKKLADTTTHATERISDQVHTLQTATQSSAEIMDTVEQTMRDMSPMADAVRIAVDGTDGSHVGEEYGQIDGLAKMAELLRGEVVTFVSHLRDETC